ncbi:MAG: hypothetical protein Q609_ECAC02805G0001, partial [Escherichia coli DORA_A_5_14_21]
MLYEDSRAMLIAIIILMREGKSWIRRYWTRVIAVIPAKVMDRALLDGGYRCYTGEKIDVYFNTAICQHSGNCVRGNGKLFNLKRKPWIMPDEVDVA